MKYYNYPNGTKTAEALDSENTSVVKGPDGKYLVPNELPAITANDKGKIVRVKADGTGIEYTGEAELPPITSSDGGKVCKVKDDHSGVEWGEAPAGLPAFSAGSAGYVLKVNAEETGAEWNEALSIIRLTKNGSDLFTDYTTPDKLYTIKAQSQLFYYVDTDFSYSMHYFDIVIFGSAMYPYTLIIKDRLTGDLYKMDNNYTEGIKLSPYTYEPAST